MLVQLKFRGKAREAYVNLNDEEMKDYEAVKKAVLRSTLLSPDVYREGFCGVKRQSGLTYLEMACDCGLKFDQWMKSENVETIEEMRNVVLMEHFMDQVSPAIKYELISLGVRDIMEARRRAGNYCQAHGIKWMIPQVGRNHASTGETADPLSKLTSDLHTNLDLQNLIT